MILALLVVGFAYLCFSVLAPWQLGKNGRTSHRNHLIEESVKAEPVAIGHLIGPGRTGAQAGVEWRRITATGRYLPDSTVLVRLRHVDDSPAYEVLTAFRLDESIGGGTPNRASAADPPRTVLVDRGYVRPVGDIQTKPPTAVTTAPPDGEITLTARIRRSEGITEGKNPIDQDGYRQVYSIDSDQVGGVLRMPLVKGYLQLEANQPGAFRPVALPQLDAGPYLSYGLQWLAFGIMAPLGLAYFVRAELTERRKAARTPDVPPTPTAGSDATTAAGGDGSPIAETSRAATEPTPTPTPSSGSTPSPVSIEAKLADRYGGRR